MTRFKTAFAAFSLVFAVSAMTSFADTLVMRTGRSYRGVLLSVRDGRIEFETERGRTERFDVVDVERIEFGRESSEGRRRENGPSERPSGLREREVNVQGANAWTRTSIELRDGQDLWFESRGEVRWGPGRKDGPGGENGSPRNANRPIPSRPGASLIGKIGENGDPFFIGADKGPIRVRGRGTLFLGVNDDYLQDNSGAFHVIVYY